MLRKNLVLLVVGGLGLYMFRAARAPLEPGRLRLPRAGTDHWDMVDQRSAESFPASDPPGTY